MSHVLNYPSQAPKARAVAVVGDSFLHDLALQEVVSSQGVPLRSLWLRGKSREVLSEQTLVGSSGWLIRDGVESLTVRDVPMISRLIKASPLVISGSDWADEEFRQWWSRSAARKTFDSVKMSTPSSRKLLVSWVAEHGRLSSSLASFACERVGFSPELAVALARKARPFDGSLAASDLTLLAEDFFSPPFTEHLVQFQHREAVEAAERLSVVERKAVFRQAADALVLMGKIYPVVVRFPNPCVEASRVSRVPITTLGKYWRVAGRYSPQEVLYRFDLLRYLTESSPRDYGSLVSLVSMW